jgi:asparagine synthase (glutamine-hydrolysing)
MCGIFALLNNDAFSMKVVTNEFMKGQYRGPEFSKLETTYPLLQLGFHRLAINGLNDESNQPLIIDDVALICNGEIYNYKALYEAMNVDPKTGSDCEVIIHLYMKYGIEQTLIMLDGVYSFILYDNKSKNAYVARDPLGVRPLYYCQIQNESYGLIHGFASEMKCLEHFYNKRNGPGKLVQFSPGTYSVFKIVEEQFICERENVSYYLPTFSYTTNNNNECKQITNYLVSAVNKRCCTTERPIACLLSGGLDSSLIAALVNDYYNKTNKSTKLETYSIGLKESEDLKYARKVADYLGTNHTEIVVSEDDMFNAIPDVIKAIESYDTTSVRASIGNYLIGKYISEHSEAKVIFNGDGSDELFGGYLYMNKCPDDIEFDKETRRLLKDIYLFDVLRSDKCISSHGLEPRTPFLDKTFVNVVLSIPPYDRNHKNYASCLPYGSIEKTVLRSSFSEYKDANNRLILPEEILWRKKEAFSDGVSSHGRSLYIILQERIAAKLCLETGQHYEANIDTEKMHYLKLFETYYPNCKHILPYFWMPKYTDAVDPSARTLDIYK